MERSQLFASAEVQSAYQAALGACLVVEHPAPGLLRLQGADVLPFLHRMSTNDLIALAPGGRRGTVLTTAIGRTVDVVEVLRRPDDLLMLTTPGRAAAVQEWLGRYIFFNDDVRLEAGVTPVSRLGVYGPTSAAVVERAVGPPPVEAGSFSEVGDGQLWATASPLPGWQILARQEAAARLLETWVQYGFGSSGLQAYEILRVERGLPAVGHEIDDEVIPLEVGLWDLVSFAKGCYIGQEVIARLESRNRVARRLVGLRLEQVEATPQEVLRDGQPVGRLTSTAVSPRFGPIGLALVRAAAIESPSGEIALSPSGGAATIAPLPFVDASV